MQIEDSPLDRTPDLVAKVRKLREQAEKEMNQFTHAEDYDVRCVVGQKPKTVPRPEEAEPVSPAGSGGKRKRARSSEDQAMIEFSPAPPEQGEGGEDQ
jgi:hypothetical protein